MRSLIPLTVYCISLVSLQQLLALPAEERPDRSRSILDMLPSSQNREATPTQRTSPDLSTDATSSSPSRPHKRLPGTFAHRAAAYPSLAWAQPAPAAPHVRRRAIRGRRHTHSRGVHHYPHHGQLMRVGCVLGTCQVQNLSHRLYQLIGQSGREDSSPINPRSPHSYG